MMQQLNLFTEKNCSHCGEPMAPNPKAPHLANGFYDQDTQELVHWHCKATHYEKKYKKGMDGLYSEVPLFL
ncbi:hypothetical protein [Flavobacterium suaedae]|uniref:hypothetical protein n=1 Tax=Flavobacterium suaedae TaxID=1767027 RepID=UPI0016674092|nr:hypothetical protein [Flavobacterium suaedae]